MKPIQNHLKQIQKKLKHIAVVWKKHIKRYGRNHFPTLMHAWETKVDFHPFRFIFVGLAVFSVFVVAIAFANIPTIQKLTVGSRAQENPLKIWVHPHAENVWDVYVTGQTGKKYAAYWVPLSNSYTEMDTQMEFLEIHLETDLTDLSKRILEGDNKNPDGTYKTRTDGWTGVARLSSRLEGESFGSDPCRMPQRLFRVVGSKPIIHESSDSKPKLYRIEGMGENVSAFPPEELTVIDPPNCDGETPPDNPTPTPVPADTLCEEFNTQVTKTDQHNNWVCREVSCSQSDADPCTDLGVPRGERWCHGLPSGRDVCLQYSPGDGQGGGNTALCQQFDGILAQKTEQEKAVYNGWRCTGRSCKEGGIEVCEGGEGTRWCHGVGDDDVCLLYDPGQAGGGEAEPPQSTPVPGSGKPIRHPAHDTDAPVNIDDYDGGDPEYFWKYPPDSNDPIPVTKWVKCSGDNQECIDKDAGDWCYAGHCASN